MVFKPSLCMHTLVRELVYLYALVMKRKWFLGDILSKCSCKIKQIDSCDDEENTESCTGSIIVIFSLNDPPQLIFVESLSKQ